MTRCDFCETIEGKIILGTENDKFEFKCGECGAEDEITFYDEDYGKDR